MSDFLQGQQAKVYQRVFNRDLCDWASPKAIGANRWLIDSCKQFKENPGFMLEYERRLRAYQAMHGGGGQIVVSMTDDERIMAHMNRGWQFLTGIYGQVIGSTLLHTFGTQVLMSMSFWMDEVGVTVAQADAATIQYNASIAREILLGAMSSGTYPKPHTWEEDRDKLVGTIVDLLPLSYDEVDQLEDFAEHDSRCKRPYGGKKLN